jgi:hypothetical protein
MDLEDFKSLRVHLEQVTPITDAFCNRYGFVSMSQQSIGRYPRIRLTKDMDIHYWIDLWMAYDTNGKRFTRFFDEVPYDLAAGASFFDESDEGNKIRHQMNVSIWKIEPFNKMITTLEASLELAFKIISPWTMADLKAKGEKILIRNRTT